MALVCPINRPFNVADSICGRFLDDEWHYLAHPNGTCVDFYTFSGNYPLLAKSIDFAEDLGGGFISSIHELYSVEKKDKFLITVSNDAWDNNIPESFLDSELSALYRYDGSKLESLGSFKRHQLFTSYSAKDCVAVVCGSKVYLYTEDFHGHFVTLDAPIVSIHWLYNRLFLIETDKQLTFHSFSESKLKYKQVFKYESETTVGVTSVGLSLLQGTYYINTKDGIYLFHTSSKYDFLKSNSESAEPLIYQLPYFGSYVGAVFCSEKGVYRSEGNSLVKTLDFTSNRVIFKGPYMIHYENNLCTFKSLHVSDKIEELTRLSFESLDFGDIVSMYRTSVGNHYIGKQSPGKYCEAINSLAFQTIKAFPKTDKGRIEDIFWISSEEVLVTGDGFAFSVNINTLEEDHEHYEDFLTIYADSVYQVSSEIVWVEDKKLDNPLKDDILMASRFKDKLVIASQTEIALISPNSDVSRITSESCILNLTDGGYATPKGKAYFDGGFVPGPSPDKVYTHICNTTMGTLYASLDGDVDIQPGFSRRPERLDVRSVVDSYECGAGTIVRSDAVSYLYLANSVVKLADKGSKILLSNDMSQCVSLENGTVSVKKNVGMRLAVSEIKPCTSFPDAPLKLCNEYFVWYHDNESASGNIVHIKSLKDGKTKEFSFPHELGCTYSYAISPNGFIVQVIYTPKPTAGEYTCTLKTYDQKNTKAAIDELSIHVYLANTSFELIEKQFQAFQGNEVILCQYKKPNRGNVPPGHNKYTKILAVDQAGKLKLPRGYGQMNPWQEQSQLLDSRSYFRDNQFLLSVDFHSGNEPRLVSEQVRTSDCIRNELKNTKYSYGVFKNVWQYIAFTNSRQVRSPVRVQRLDLMGPVTNTGHIDSFNFYENKHVSPVLACGLPTKYYPNFVVSGSSCIYTVTLLNEVEGPILKKIQDKFYSPDSMKTESPQIDAELLLKIASDPSNHSAFVDEGIDRKTLLYGLRELMQ